MSEDLLIKMRSMRGCPVKAAAHLGITPSAITNWKAVPRRFEKKLRAFLDTYKAPKPKSKVYIKWRDDERAILCDMKAAGASNADIALVLKREEISIAQQISFLFRRHGPDWARMLSATTECDLDEPSCPNEAWSVASQRGRIGSMTHGPECPRYREFDREHDNNISGQSRCGRCP